MMRFAHLLLVPWLAGGTVGTLAILDGQSIAEELDDIIHLGISVCR
jgi:hypothetical protein